MVWYFAEANPFSNSSGCFDNMLDWIYKSVKSLPARVVGEVINHSALKKFPLSNVIVSTDPPYYDNIGYANLSDFFLCVDASSATKNLSATFRAHELSKVGRTYRGTCAA